MKILQIIPTLETGGGEMFCVNLSNCLSDRFNHDVTICVLSKINNNSLLFKRISKDVKIISLNKGLGFNIKTFFKLYKTINEINPDIVHTHLRSIIYIFLSVLINRNIKFIHTIHTLIEKEAQALYRKLLYKFYFSMNLITPVSITLTVKSGLQKMFGNKFTKIIENGVPKLVNDYNNTSALSEILKVKFDENSKIIISIGRINKIKNQLFLIDIMKDFQKENKNIILLLIGSLENDTNYTKQCKEYAQGLTNTYLLGEKENVADFIHLADCICLSSIYEGHPLIILESLSMGKEIISTKVGGIPDILSNNLGTMVNAGDKKDYKEKILAILNQNEDRKNLIIKNFDEKYHIDLCCSKYLELYESEIKGKITK